MGFDEFQSRRGYNEECVWWSRNEDDDIDVNDLILKRVPSGYFMAKEESPESNRENTIYNTFSLEKTLITIKTPDNIYGIKQKDLVLFRGEKWFVVSIQKIKARLQQSEFANDKNRSHFWYLELRK